MPTVTIEWYDASYYLGVHLNTSTVWKNGPEPKQNLGSWNNDGSWHTWTFLVTTSGVYPATVASFDLYQDSTKIVTGASSIPFGPYPRGNYDRFSLYCWTGA